MIFRSNVVSKVIFMQKQHILRTVLALIASAAITTGCGGGGAKVEATSTSTTMGQELMDLDAAYKQGIITQEQYEKSKKETLKRYEK
jgi:hypothetical protein